jgi:type II secretion system protein H
MTKSERNPKFEIRTTLRNREAARNSFIGLRISGFFRPSDFGYRHSARGAFTLIELILVLALLAIVVSIAAPALGKFFRGRILDSETRRLLALTRHGRERAVSEGFPVVLWIDAAGRKYGMQAENGFTEQDSKAISLDIDRDLQIEVTETTTHSTPVMGGKQGTLPAIRFLPDGTLGESSPASLRLRDRDGSLVLAQARNRISYEIRTQNNVWNSSRY